MSRALTYTADLPSGVKPASCHVRGIQQIAISGMTRVYLAINREGPFDGSSTDVLNCNEISRTCTSG